MNTLSIIKKKRDKLTLSPSEIEFLISSYTINKIPDYQFSAFLMAGLLNGFNEQETSALVNSMLHSGRILDLSFLKGKKIDKHSTGGVGDKTSLIIAPIVAAAGIYVPMISGRGLGHTGGTLDKLESIPDFNVNLSIHQFKSALKKCGAVLIGQTKDIAPADKKIYALRDATATVESIPLITASIMSKKLAEGIDGIVFDVKTGNGAFMKTTAGSKALAKSLVETAKRFNKKVIAYITDMNQPLGNYIGNWLEILEVIKVLKGEVNNDLTKLSIELAGGMLYLGNKTNSVKSGVQLSKEIIKSGKAFDKFLDIVKIQRGNISYILNPEKYPRAKYSEKVYSKKSGYVKGIDCLQLGLTAMELGAGRKTIEDKIDLKAGIIFHPKIGDYIEKNEIIAEIFSDKNNVIDIAKTQIQDSIKTSKYKPKKPKLIKEIITLI